MTWRVAMALLVMLAMGCRGDREKPAPASAAEPARATPAVSTREVPERIVISQIALETAQTDTTREVYPRIVAQDLGRMLAETPWFYAVDRQVPPGVRGRPASLAVQISYDIVDAADGGRAALVAADGRFRWDDGGTALAPRESILVERRLAAADQARLDGVIAEQVAHTVARVGHGLIAKEAVRSGDADHVVEAAAGDDEDLAGWALQVIGERKLAAGYDVAVARLAGDGLLRQHAIAALTALGDARAVGAIARHAPMDDPDGMRIAIDAVAALGGDEASSYLEFVASGHPDPDIQARARSALARLASGAGAP